ncbi:MAG: ABC transporter permease, partial [Trueperaceae bacterium]
TEHLLGTDQLGRDILSRLIYGSRISLFVGAAAVLGAGLLGSVLGLLAGYFGGRLDYIISTLINAAWSFPFILLALIIVAVLGASLQNLVIALVATSWAAFARIVRGEVIAQRELDYVTAARSTGLPALRILLRHVLPNVSSSILVIASIEFGRAIIRESFLSFLGLGVPPSIPSWGGMLSEARPYIFTLPLLVTMPGALIFVTTLSVNLFGDGLRDALDPRLRNR